LVVSAAALYAIGRLSVGGRRGRVAALATTLAVAGVPLTLWQLVALALSSLVAWLVPLSPALLAMTIGLGASTLVLVVIAIRESLALTTARTALTLASPFLFVLVTGTCTLVSKLTFRRG
jgi:hypothetical protein